MTRSVLLTLMLPYCLYASGKKKPNIIFILADDLGYGDISSFNTLGKIKTPNVDRLAKNGVVFTDAHSGSSVSTPTRYGILTGRYSWRSSLKRSVLGPYGEPIITEGRTTMATMLASQGYNTACFGKWHLGMTHVTTDGKKPYDKKDGCNINFEEAIKDGPCDRGFDYYFGVNAPNYPPFCYIKNRHTIGIPKTFYPNKPLPLGCTAGSGVENWDLYEILPQLEKEVVSYIRDKSKEESPFFIYFPLTSPHTPIVVNEKYKNSSGLNNLYADFVIETDALVGSIIKTLEETGELDNTIIVFTSDNGCSGVAKVNELKAAGHSPSGEFRGYKSDIYEGGHRVPCVVSWPNEFTHKVVKQTICLNDFMATFADIVGYKIADDEAEDSYNLLSICKKGDGKKEIREATVHHSFEGCFAIRQGKWKLILTPTSGGWSYPSKPIPNQPRYQLYNLEEDIAEKINLYSEYPKVVAELESLLIRYIKDGRSTKGKPQSNDVYPWKQLSWMENK